MDSTEALSLLINSGNSGVSAQNEGIEEIKGDFKSIVVTTDDSGDKHVKIAGSNYAFDSIVKDNVISIVDCADVTYSTGKLNYVDN